MASLAAKSSLAHAKPLVFAGLSMSEEPALHVTHLIEPRKDPAFRERLTRTLGVEPPQRPNTVAASQSTRVAWIAPGQWLAIGGAAKAADGVDVSDAYAAIRILGPRVADLLSKSVPVDLSAASFPQQRCARTLMGSIPVVLLREDDGFLILVERGLAHAAWIWLADGTAAFNR